MPASTQPRRPRRARREREPTGDLPVARVCVDIPLPHLDRAFEYLVPVELGQAAVAGVRVRVRFAGQLIDGFVLERRSEPEHTGRLAYLERVVSPEPVLSPEVAALARSVADRYAGTLVDVLRLAVPPRHARVETSASRAESSAPAAAPAVGAPDRPRAPDPSGWGRYPHGPAYLHALATGRAPRAVWSALPGEPWPARFAEAVAGTLHSGRGALVVVADARDLDRLDAALIAALGTGEHLALSAALGPAERYRRFLAVRRGQVRAVIGTRAAMFAPVPDLGLVAIWDDGDDLFAEPRAPYPHAREVLLTRAEAVGAGALLGGYARSVEAQQLLESGWAKPVVANRDTIRAAAPSVLPTGDDRRDPGAGAARLPSLAWRTAREALAAGAPVLVQVPRRGYLPSVACADCRTPARCPHCRGPLALPAATGPAACRWCGRVCTAFTCPTCGARRIRAAVVGARRTAEELGRAFPGAVVRTSGRDGVLSTVPDEPALVVATPGAEPVPEGAGYGAVLLLDSWALLGRADLRAGEETLRRWMAAAALARPGSAGGRVVVVAEGGLAPVQALLRFDPGVLAARELTERRELGFPPAVRMASLTGTPAAVADLLSVARLPAGVEVLGPVPVAERAQPGGSGGSQPGDPGGSEPGERGGPERGGEPCERMLIRTGRSAGRALAASLREAAAVRSARKATGSVRVQIDPLEIL